jgi:hypothetical protein
MKSLLASKVLNLTLVGLVVLFICLFLSEGVYADSFLNIGCGNPGLKVTSRPFDANAVVIYHETPEIPIGGSIGPDMTNEIIQVIVDHEYHFQKESMVGLGSGIPLQLYPYAPNSAFTDPAGEDWSWGNSNRWSLEETGYTFKNGNLTTFTNVQQMARIKYHLSNDEIFLGFLDDRVFFCKNGFRSSKVFWREQGSQKEYYYRMPRAVLDLYGVTKALHQHKDVSIVVFRKVWRFVPFLEPFEITFMEIPLSEGKLVRPEE